MTKSEKDYLNRLAALGCIVCRNEGLYGVAFHAGKKAWEAKYGTERALMEQALALVVAERKKLVGAV